MSDENKTEELKGEIVDTKNKLLKKLEEDGVINPRQLSYIGAAFLFMAAVPLTSFLAQPSGSLEKIVNALCRGIVYVGSTGSTSKVSQTSKIAALSALYMVATYPVSGAASVAGVASAQKEGRDNKHPRAQCQNLRGLPLRLHSAHYHLLEKFPGFALAAALAQTMAPGEQTLINLLGLHVISKVFVHYPSYILNVDGPRSLAHVIATASAVNVALKLSKRP